MNALQGMQKYLRGSVRKTNSERMTLETVEAWLESVNDFLVLNKNANKQTKKNYTKVSKWVLGAYILKAEKMSHSGKCQLLTF